MIRGLENTMFNDELKDVAPLSLKERRLGNSLQIYSSRKQRRLKFEHTGLAY